MTPDKPSTPSKKYDPRAVRRSFGPRCVLCLRTTEDGATLLEPGSDRPWCARDARAIAYASHPEALPSEPQEVRDLSAKLLASGWKEGAPIAPGFFKG